MENISEKENLKNFIKRKRDEHPASGIAQIKINPNFNLNDYGEDYALAIQSKKYKELVSQKKELKQEVLKKLQMEIQEYWVNQKRSIRNVFGRIDLHLDELPEYLQDKVLALNTEMESLDKEILEEKQKAGIQKFKISRQMRSLAQEKKSEQTNSENDLIYEFDEQGVAVEPTTYTPQNKVEVNAPKETQEKEDLNLEKNINTSKETQDNLKEKIQNDFEEYFKFELLMEKRNLNKSEVVRFNSLRNSYLNRMKRYDSSYGSEQNNYKDQIKQVEEFNSHDANVSRRIKQAVHDNEKNFNKPLMDRPEYFQGDLVNEKSFISQVEKDISLENINELKLDFAMFHSGNGFSGIGTKSIENRLEKKKDSFFVRNDFQTFDRSSRKEKKEEFISVTKRYACKNSVFWVNHILLLLQLKK